MTAEHDPLMNPYTLSDGRKVMVRRTTASVIRKQREERHDRGYDDEVLDNLNVLPLVLFQEDGQAADEVFIETIAESDLVQIYGIAKGVNRPNPSAPSSDGTPGATPKAKARSKARPRSNG